MYADSGWSTEFVGYEILGQDDAIVHDATDGLQREEDAEFAALLDPPTALSLISALRASEAERERLAKALENMERGRNWFHRNSTEQAEEIDALREFYHADKAVRDVGRMYSTAEQDARLVRARAALRTRPSGGDADQ
jgi:hypothetical protein